MRKNGLQDYLLFLEAWIFLIVAKLMILFFPFKKIASAIGDKQLESDFDIPVDENVFAIQLALNRGVRFVFFESKCYDQALATTFMLKRRQIPSTIYFGLSKVSSQLTAHAWVRCGREIVSGKKGYEKYTPVAWFYSKPKD